MRAITSLLLLTAATSAHAGFDNYCPQPDRHYKVYDRGLSKANQHFTIYRKLSSFATYVFVNDATDEIYKCLYDIDSRPSKDHKQPTKRRHPAFVFMNEENLLEHLGLPIYVNSSVDIRAKMEEFSNDPHRNRKYNWIYDYQEEYGESSIHIVRYVGKSDINTSHIEIRHRERARIMTELQLPNVNLDNF